MQKYLFLFLLLIYNFVKQTYAAGPIICFPEIPCATCKFVSTQCTACIERHFLLGDECIPCTYPCVGCESTKRCYNCDIEYSGYYLSGTTCLPCEYPCKTCYSPTYCYSCGWDVERRTEDRYCNCEAIYFEYQQACILCVSPCLACSSPEFCFDCDNMKTGLYPKSGKCVPCEYPCLTCSSKTYCYSCGYDVEKRVADSTCRCKDGWWDDKSECRPCITPCTACTSETFCTWCDSNNTGLYADKNGICKPCYYPCVMCKGPGVCITCGWDIENRKTDSTCTCLRGYYECGTKCKPCIAPCKACTSETNCIDCNNATSGYYYKDYCRPCDYPCVTCDDNMKCLTCGYEPTKRNAIPGCTCKVGYYELGYSCMDCVAPCIKCSSPSICQDCNHATSGYYLSGVDCILCPYPCSKCTAPTNCLECGWDVQNRYAGTATCLCLPGFFEYGVSCLKCSPPCNQCVDIAIKCLTCITGTYMDDNGQCEYCVFPCVTCQNKTNCITCGWEPERRYTPKKTGGYTIYLGEIIYQYDDMTCHCLDGFYKSQYNCLPCELPCVKCSAKNVCITFNCENAVSGRYYDSVAFNCITCPYPCATCNDNKTCITCGYMPNLRTQNNTCPCKDTYYQLGQDCLPCQLPCVKCSSASVCITTNYQEIISSQFYNSSTGQMQFCSYPCLTCKTTATNCLACGYDSVNRNAAPGCGCKSGFYQDVQVCRPCVRPCLTCSSETVCITLVCNTHNGIITKLFIQGLGCVPCQYPCLTCINTPTECQTCGYGASRRVTPGAYKRTCYYCWGWDYQNDFTCQCSNGYYHNAVKKECLPCVKPCTRCQNQDTCIIESRYDDYTYYTNYYTDYCSEGTNLLWVNTSNYSLCYPCTYPCKTCKLGSGREYCYSCGYGPANRVAPYIYNTYHGYWDRNCDCKSGYYEEGQECKKCELPCLTCSSLTVCKTIFDCDKTISGLYPSGIQCLKCVYPCKTCTGTTSCLSCGYDLENRNSAASNCSCKSGFYEDKSLQSCFSCVLPCLTCTSQTACITIYDCDQTISGYFPYNGVCTPCPYPCITCSGITTCLTCGFEPTLRNAAPGCSCKTGTYSYQNSCKVCQLPCSTCSDEVTCITTYDCSNSTSGMYPSSGNCLLCQYPCKTCTSATVCTTCKGNLANRKVAPTCTCNDGYYNRGEECVKCELPCITCSSPTTCLTRDDCDKSISKKYVSGLQCYACQYPCITCSSTTSCLTCEYEITHRDNTTTCPCSSGFYLQTSNAVCMKCRLPCLTCNGPNSTQCITYYPCQSGQVRSASDYKCYACQYPCLTCTNYSSTYCATCGYGVNNRYAPGTHLGYYIGYVYDCRCKDGYYHFASLQVCLPCVYPCTSCSTSSNCSNTADCNYTVTGTFLSGNKCIECKYPCQTCYYNATNCYSCGYEPTKRVTPYCTNYYYNSWDRNCNCQSGYYESGQQCLTCLAPCVTCTDIYKCTTWNCENATSKQYWNKTEKKCMDCEYPCLTCSNNSLDCLTCYNNVSARKAIPNCGCLTGYYEQDNNCYKCVLPCATCTSESKCLTYNCQNSTSGLYLYTPENNGAWVPDGCNTWSLIDQLDAGCAQVTPVCAPCPYPCLTCNAPLDCISCGYTPLLRLAKSCDCDAMLKTDYSCINRDCLHPCINCASKDAPDSCTSCVDGYFLAGDSCTKCKDVCLRCSGLNTCTACTKDYYLLDGKCTPCEYPCITCISKTFCLSCGTDAEFRNLPPTCSCKSIYFDTGKTCDKCILPCDKCTASNVNSCSTCITGYYLSGTMCAFCPSSCISCTSPTVCTSCYPGYYLKGNICTPCVYPCLTCATTVFCYTCYDDVSTRYPAPDCSCNTRVSKFFDNGKQRCTQCTAPLQACDPESKFPLSCVDGYYLNKNGTTITLFIESATGASKKLKDICVCPEGETCDLDPVACSEENKYLIGDYKDFPHSECIQCPEGNAVCTNATTATKCLDGYYYLNKACIKCKTPCARCINDTFCLECGYDPTNRRQQLPYCKCDEIYSDHGDKCDTCTDPCKTCYGFGLDQCLSCNDYYYIDTNDHTCKECHPSCLRCTGPLETNCELGKNLLCQTGYYSNSGVCKQCIYPCATCASDKYCLTCGYDVDNRYAAPFCECRDEFSDYDNRCIVCTTPCRQCTSESTDSCTSCIHSTYLVGTQCLDCDVSCKRCSTGPLVCQMCNDSWYLDGNQCKACIYPCVNCYSANRCYTCGFVPERRYPAPGCNCMYEYTEYQQQCLLCATPCLRCTGETDQECTSCIQGYYLDTTICIKCQTGCLSCIKAGECLNCIDGYYMDTDGKTCVPCVAPCVTCFSATFCYTCGYTPERRVKPPSCACKIAYTPIGLEICDSCTPPCSTCTTVAETDCLSCINGYYLISTGPSSCGKCNDPCKLCVTTADTCTSCIAGYYFKVTTSSSYCEICKYPCATCFSDTQCVTCGYDPTLRTDPPKCQCKNGLADTGTTCGSCISPCYQCFAMTSTSCLSCNVGDYLSGTECLSCNDGCISCKGSSSACDKCEDGYFNNGTTCIKCSYPCATCYTLTQCVTCGYDTARRRDPPTCECLRDLYSDNGNGECIVCTSPCHSCYSLADNDCISCVHGYYLVGKECVKCADGCKWCGNIADETKRSFTCSECYDGYFMKSDGITCAPCISPCATCSGSSTNCIKCGYGLDKRVGPPTCKCFTNLDDGIDSCDVCTGLCVHCIKPTQCTECVDEYIVNLDTHECEPCQLGCAQCTLADKAICSKCIDTYFLRSNACLPCVYPCINCLESDYCYTCGYDADNRRNIPPSCSCKDDYSDNGERCVLCTSPCLTCMTEEITDCLTCVIGYYFNLIIDNLGTCELCDISCTHCTELNVCQQCASTYYLEGSLCLPCVYPCETCLTATFCYTCGYDAANKYQPPKCICKEQFSDSLDPLLGCVTCLDPCKTCMTAANNDCTSCIDDYYLVGTECLQCHPGCNVCIDDTLIGCTQCNDGYWLDAEGCHPCLHPCVNCLSNTRCLSCVNGIGRGQTPSCACENFYYDNGEVDCIECPIPGGICKNSDPNYYITCANGYYYVLDGTTPTCPQCPSVCKSCYNENFCYECSSTSNRGAAPFCQCAQGYYHDGTDCQQCPFPSLVCTSAVDYQACSDGYFVDGSTCTKCSYPCITCIVDLSCLSCGYDIADRNPIPDCGCIDGYYDDRNADGTVKQDCIQCPTPSITCQTPTVFLSCIDTYYHKSDTNECIPCLYPCKYCISPVFCTLCGFDVANRAAPPTCKCLYGLFYQKNVSDLVCTDCNVDSNHCIQCISYNECISCKPGFTLEGTTCVPCQPPCQTCVGTICLTCGLAEEGSNTPSCDCLNETADSGTYRTCYDNSDVNCAPKPCVAPCENCKSETTCITCLDNQNRLDPPDCGCKTGFELNILDKCVTNTCLAGQFGVDQNCESCVSPCATCNGLATKCLTCLLGYKYYGNYECVVSCQFPCSDCLDNDPFTCKSKCAGLQRDLSKNCACQDGFYQDSNKLCLACSYPCKNCSGPTTCLSCPDDGQMRKSIELGCGCQDGYTPYLLLCIENCQKGYFLHYDKCLECFPQCVTCEGVGSNCLECTYAYYQSTLTCEKCPTNCGTCGKDSNGVIGCLTCYEGAIGRVNQIPDCQCKDGFFDRDTIDCGECTVPCQTCSVTRINCLTCVEGGVNRRLPPDCNCLDGYFGENGTCVQCNYTCKLCDFLAVYCTACYGTGVGRSTNLPDCECLDTYYDDGKNNDCQPCEYPCINCVTTATTCLTCMFPLENRKPTPDCNCIEGEFKDPNMHCQKCLWKCSTCIDTLDNCLTCGEINRTTPVCNCRDGFFGLDPNLECHTCYNKCKRCESVPENCLECFNYENRVVEPSCECQPTFYQNEQGNCVSCPHPCKLCSDYNTCITCVDDSDPHRKDISFNCRCDTGYFTNGSICEKCDVSCITCVGTATNCLTKNPFLETCDYQCVSCMGQTDNCIQCTNGFMRTMKQPECGCKDGYYNNGKIDCQKCPSNCLTCDNGTSCLTCINNGGINLKPPFCTSTQNNFSVVINGQLIQTDCDMQCATCNTQSNNCTLCSTGIKRSDIIPECLCQEGYYDNHYQYFDCQPCRVECQTCTEYNFCTSCKEEYNRIINPLSALCECMEGYRENIKGDLSCTKCYTYGHNCYTVCPANTKQNDTDYICEDYTVGIPSNKMLLFIAAGLYALFYIVFCSGVIGKYRMRMQGLRPIEPKIEFQEVEAKQLVKQGVKPSRIMSYFQSGFTQQENPEINISSSSSDKDDKEQPKVSQYQPHYRGQTKPKDDDEDDKNKQRKHKPKLSNLISSLIGKAKQQETKKLQILSSNLGIKENNQQGKAITTNTARSVENTSNNLLKNKQLQIVEDIEEDNQTEEQKQDQSKEQQKQNPEQNLLSVNQSDQTSNILLSSNASNNSNKKLMKSRITNSKQSQRSKQTFNLDDPSKKQNNLSSSINKSNSIQNNKMDNINEVINLENDIQIMESRQNSTMHQMQTLNSPQQMKKIDLIPLNDLESAKSKQGEELQHNEDQIPNNPIVSQKEDLEQEDLNKNQENQDIKEEDDDDNII